MKNASNKENEELEKYKKENEELKRIIKEMTKTFAKFRIQY